MMIDQFKAQLHHQLGFFEHSLMVCIFIDKHLKSYYTIIFFSLVYIFRC